MERCACLNSVSKKLCCFQRIDAGRFPGGKASVILSAKRRNQTARGFQPLSGEAKNIAHFNE